MSELLYKKWVLSVYDARLIAGQLSPELRSPTPADLKKETLRVCEKELTQQDTTIIRPFVHQKDEATSFYHAIKHHNAQPFKTLSNFLKDRSIDTHSRNIDLLACLLDLKPRPFRPGIVIPAIVSPLEEIMEEPTPAAPPPEPKKIKDQRTEKSQLKNILMASILLVCFAGLVIILPWKKHYTGREGCMIWNDDHYEPTDCNNQSSGKPLYPIKHELVDHFKKIADPKTLTLASLGKVWYGKYDGNIDFFTDSGPHPLDTNRRVLPMSIHIYQKYILHTTN